MENSIENIVINGISSRYDLCSKNTRTDND